MYENGKSSQISKPPQNLLENGMSFQICNLSPKSHIRKNFILKCLLSITCSRLIFCSDNGLRPLSLNPFLLYHVEWSLWAPRLGNAMTVYENNNTPLITFLWPCSSFSRTRPAIFHSGKDFARTVSDQSRVFQTIKSFSKHCLTYENRLLWAISNRNSV